VHDSIEEQPKKVLMERIELRLKLKKKTASRIRQLRYSSLPKQLTLSFDEHVA
jgi:hypothetical protein